MKRQYILLILLSTTILLNSCKKYLDKKSDASLLVPSTLEDFQALLDDANTMNSQTPSFLEVAADDLFVTDANYNAITKEQPAYTWREFIYRYQNDWSRSYSIIYNANLCLERINKISKTTQNQNKWNNVMGSALFYRAYTFLQLCWTFSKAYDAGFSEQDYGIVLRLGTDFNTPSIRASVKESYQQILNDLYKANDYLPEVSSIPMRPSKAASYALLARTYLSMRKYDSAFKYSDLSLQIKSDLLDFNSPDVISGNIPFQDYPFNKEVIFYTIMSNSFALKSPSRALIDSILYSSYALSDKRRTVFFRNNNGYQRFKGSYSANSNSIFSGLATDEVLLIRAECNARANRITEAMTDLNTLLEKRWTSGGFTPLTASSQDEAINIILTERRKELLMRGLRWMDIKRLNKEGVNITLKRIVMGQVYTLPPNDDRFALPLPNDIINLTGMPQN